MCTKLRTFSFIKKRKLDSEEKGSVDSGDEYTHISPVNCYQELMAELTNDGTWMRETYL